MLPSGAAHAACVAMVALPASHGTQPQSYSSLVAGCAFCGGHAMPLCSRGWSAGRSGVSTVHHASRSQLLQGGSSSARSDVREAIGRFGTAARWWEGDDAEDGSGNEARTVRRKPLRAPWEDIQWNNSNNGKRRASREGEGKGRVRWEDDDGGEDEILGVGELPRGSFRSRGYRDYYDDYVGDDNRLRRRRPRDEEPGVEARSSSWDAAGWFSGAEQANQGGVFEWARSFYNTVFWYGAATSRGLDELPAMNFQDLLERYDLPDGERSSARALPIVPPEDLAAEQDFRWRPSERDSASSGAVGATAAEETRRRRGGRPRISSVPEGSRRQAWREPEGDFGWEEREPGRRERGGNRRAATAKGGNAGGAEDAAVVEQLRRKQRQLAEREHKFQVNLEKVRERLGVVDATVELWIRRSAGMLSRGGSETDTDVLQAKRRIYGLKNEGRQLDDAVVELEGRLEDCGAKLDRVVQELEFLGESAVPQVFYTPDGQRGEEEVETAEAGTQTRAEDIEASSSPPPGASSGTGVVGIDALGLKPDERDVKAVEAVPAAREADV